MDLDVFDVPAGQSDSVCLDAVISAVVGDENRMRPLRLECRRIAVRHAAGVADLDDLRRYRMARLALRMRGSARSRACLPRGAAEVLARSAELTVEAMVGEDVPAGSAGVTVVE